MNFAYEQPSPEQPQRRSQRVDKLASIQAAFTGACLLVFCCLALEATWKVRFWRQTTGEVVTSSTICRVVSQSQWWGRNKARAGSWQPCSGISGSAILDGYETREKAWRVSIAYVDTDERQQSFSVDVTIQQAARLLGKTTVSRGDHLPMAHSNMWAERADLSDNLLFWRMLWIVVLAGACVLAGLSFLLWMPAESEEELEEFRRDKFRGWHD